MKTKRIVLSVALLLTMGLIANADPVEEGRAIFSSRCAACHNVNKTMTGPALAGVYDRRSEDWIIKFIKSSQSLVKSGDKDATALFEKFNRIPMPDHPDLTDDNIKSIIEYIKKESKPVDAEKAPFAKPGKKMVNYKPLSLQEDYGLFVIYLVVVGLLISSLVFAVKLNSYRRMRDDEHA